MKLFFLLITLLTLSLSVYAVQSTEKEELNSPELTEKPQNKAREILENNFNALDQVKGKSKKINFGFKKDEEEANQNL